MKKIWKPPFQLTEKAKKLILTMKLTVFILFLTLMQVSATVYSQATRFSFKAENKQVVEVLQQIEASSDFRFFFLREQVDVERKVTVTAREATVEKILDELFRGEPVSYEFANEALIVLTRSDNPLGSVNSFLQGNMQQPAVSGTVTDESGQPLPGVTVVVKGTTQGTVTNNDGNYSITNIPEDATLVFSFVGMSTQEIQVANQTSINVTMEVDAIGIEEVVAIGYGTMKRASVVGSVASVKPNDLVTVPVANTTNALAGRLPGLVSSQVSGEPGLDYASINIRGFGQALVIIDGVEGRLNNINQNEIADITILKDAAAAIYGSRAGNGVVLVTTKRGGVGKPTISFDGTYSFQAPTFYPKKLNAGEYTRMIYERDLRGGIDPSKYIYPLSEVEKWEAEDSPDYTSTDWWDYLTKDYSPFKQFNLSASGGSENIKYYLGYTRADQGGILKSDAYSYIKNNFRANVDSKITDRFSVSADMSALVDDVDTPPREQDWIWPDINGVSPLWKAVLPDPDKIPYTGNVTSVIASTSPKGGYKRKNQLHFNSKLSATYMIPGIDGLRVEGMINYQHRTFEAKYFMKGYDMWQYNYAADQYSRLGSAWQTRLNEGWRQDVTLTANVGLFYKKKIDEHAINALLLSEIVDSNGKDITGSTDGFLSDQFDYLSFGSQSQGQVNGSAWEGGRLGHIGRLNYSYKSKYIMEATARYDASPVFAPNKRWGFFPSLSFAWRASEESFIKNGIPILSNFKLRAGLSKSGYDGIGNFQYLTGYRSSGLGAYDGKVVTGINPTGLANPDITWETMTLYNAGLDFGIWDDKLYGSLDMFYRYRDNILTAPYLTVPYTFGASLPQMNLNSRSNRGFEFVIGHRHRTGEFKFDVSANISYTRERNEHVEEPEYTDPDELRIKKQSGQWTDLIWGLKTDGLFTSQEEIDNYQVRIDSREEIGNSSVRVGDIKYIDQNGDGVIDWRDQVVIGRSASIARVTPNDLYGYYEQRNISAPGLMFGFNLNTSWKSIELSALFQGAARYSKWAWASDYLLYHNSYSEKNPDPNALFPLQSSGPGPSVVGGPSDYTLVDASYLRLKSLNIGYTIPDKYTFGIKCKPYIAGTNLFTLSNLTKYMMDPEAPDQGNYYPQQKVFTMGINLTL